MDAKLLIVEDDAFLRDGLIELFQREGYDARCAACAKEADALLRADEFHLVLLDIGLPDGDGVRLLKRWREDGLRTPVLFLTACDEELQVVRALDAGGSDYVTKPFRMLELLSRVRALLRRAGDAETDAVYRDGELEVDARRMLVRRAGEIVYLTKTEYLLLACLLRAHGRIVTREVLLAQIWDDAGQYIDDNTLSVHMSRLREKIGAARVRTVRGVGYAWWKSS